MLVFLGILLAFLPSVTLLRLQSLPCSGVAKNATKERQLWECLFNNYQRSMRPVIDSNHTLQINFSFHLIALAQVYDKENAMLVETYISQNWYDPRLVWDPTNYDGINKIFANKWNIWVPELTIWSRRGEDPNLVEGKKVVVSYKGEVEWTFQMKLNDYCRMDHSKFPFDKQVCRFFLQHQLYLVDTNVVEPPNTTMPKGTCYSIQDEWKVVDCKVQVTEPSWDNTNTPFIELKMTVERQYSYYYYVSVIPPILIVLLTLSLLWLPHESGQRFIAAGCMFFAIMLMNFLLQQFLPPGIGGVPIVASYLLYSTMLAISVVFVSLVSRNLYTKNSNKKDVPEIFKKIFFSAFIVKATRVSITPFMCIPNASLENKTWNEAVLQNTENILEDIRRQLRTLDSSPDRTHFVDGWKQLALIIDRLFFYVFFIASIVITIAIYAH